jgi:L-threonylcarbamoyladenylate synthase
MAMSDAAIIEATRLVLAGIPVAVPTETVYGLAADATNAAAVARIYAAKGRPSFNPLIVHVADLAAAEAIGEFSDEARSLAAAHWPGPLTLVVPLPCRASRCAFPPIPRCRLCSRPAAARLPLPRPTPAA